MSPTQRTLKWLRDHDYMPGIVERWVPDPKCPGGGKRIDLFGFIDIIAIRNGFCYGVQSCGTDHAAHANKITVECKDQVMIWLSCSSNRLVLMSWRKVKVRRGGKRMIYRPRICMYRRVGESLEVTDWGEEDSMPGQLPNVIQLQGRK